MTDDDPAPLSDAEPHGRPDAGGAEPPLGTDGVLPFQLDALDLRGRVARLGPTLDAILRGRDYPPSVSGLVGEAALITAMAGQAMKLRGRLSLQVRGDGPVSLLAADYYPADAADRPARLRAYATVDRDKAPETSAEPGALLGDGLFALTVDQGPGMAPYQGVTPLAPGGLAVSAEIFFAQSEQIATRFKIAVAAEQGPDGAQRWRAGGVMLQHLAPFGEGAPPPEASAEHGLLTADDVAEMGPSAENWRRASILLATAEETELLGPLVTPERLLIRLFHEEGPRVYSGRPVAFGCTCAAENIAAVLRRYPLEELRSMAEPGGGEIVADCQFCGAQYRFDAEALAREET